MTAETIRGARCRGHARRCGRLGGVGANLLAALHGTPHACGVYVPARLREQRVGQERRQWEEARPPVEHTIEVVVHTGQREIDAIPR